MLSKIKKIFYNNSLIDSNLNSNSDESNISNNVINKLTQFTFIDSFSNFLNSISNSDLPIKSFQILQDILLLVKTIKYDTLSSNDQVLIRTILEKNIPNIIQSYLNLPKAFAVSVVLDNGKTSKSNLLDSLTAFLKSIQSIQESILQTELEKFNKQQNIHLIKNKRIDFFDF